MSDEEVPTEQRTGSAEAQDERPAAGSPPSADDESAVDCAAESFLALEGELRDLQGGDGTLTGLAEDVERIPAGDVPEDYPVTITTEEALRLFVRPRDGLASSDDARAAVYFEWPPNDDGPLARLLSLRNVRPENFAGLHGERVPLALEDGYLVPRLPPGGNRGDPRGVYGIFAGVAVNIAVFLLGSLGAGSLLVSIPVLVALAVLNVLVLPVATYLDARHLLTTTDWDQGPLFWAALAAIPGLNVVSSLAYLYTRTGADEL